MDTLNAIPFRPVQGGNKSESIILQIEGAIVGGTYGPGDRLPSERDLQSQFQTSRGAVREALRTLRQKGLLTAKKGARGGYYVTEVDIDQAIDNLAMMIRQKQVPLSKLLDFHYAMDKAVLIAATSNATPDDIERLQDLADRLIDLCSQPEPDFDRILAVDNALNLLMVEMTKNPFFEWVMRTVQAAFRTYEFIVYQDPETRREIARNWKGTADAVRDRAIQKALGLYGHWYVLLEKCLVGRYGVKAFQGEDLTGISEPFAGESEDDRAVSE